MNVGLRPVKWTLRDRPRYIRFLEAAQLLASALPDGGTVGVSAPASPWQNRSDLLRGVEWWESHGYRVKLADGIDGRDDYVAGSAEARAADLNALFADPEVDVVHCLQGGYGSAQAIPFLDFDLIAANPKAFVGFSDITALHVAIRQRTGLATFYGPGVAGVGDTETTEFTRGRLLEVLRGGGAGAVPRDPDDPYARAIRGGTAKAPLAGGCLWLLLQTMGTPWEIDLDGAIFFFEDYDAPPWYVDGMLTQLGHAGKLDRIEGVVVGDMEKCEWRESRPEWPRTKSIEDVLEQRLEPLGIPVVYKLPLGHGKHLATLPLGVPATLDADARTLTVDEPALIQSSETLDPAGVKRRMA
ncbi:MAG: LD-carboxypeptidase [Gaiellaceae bacterium]